MAPNSKAESRCLSDHARADWCHRCGTFSGVGLSVEILANTMDKKCLRSMIAHVVHIVPVSRLKCLQAETAELDGLLPSMLDKAFRNES